LPGCSPPPAALFHPPEKGPTRSPNAHAAIVPYQTFHAADGLLVLAVGNDGQFARTCKVLGRQEWVTDSRFATNEARVENREVLVPLMEPVIAAWKRADLLAALEASGVPAGPVNTLAEAIADPQFIARELRVETDGIAGLRAPIRMSGGSLVLGRRAPRLGEHTGEVLLELESGPGE
ncbi:MAG: CoA transferase, partial [Pseudomonadota bacterium]|nr:CoA transferase [Pseudomonadota bacterium]